MLVALDAQRAGGNGARGTGHYSLTCGIEALSRVITTVVVKPPPR